MKIRVLKDKYGYKAGTEIELEDTEAKELIEKQLAEEVKVDASEEAVKALEEKLNDVADSLVESISDKATTKAIEKISKKLKRPHIVVGPDNVTLDPKGGFKSFGEFAKGVIDRSRGDDTELSRMVVKAGLADQNSADGPLLPTEYSDQFFQVIQSDDYYPNLAFNLSTNFLNFKLPVDSLTSLGTNAVSGAWGSGVGGNFPYDGNAGTEKGTGIANQRSFGLNKYMTLVGVTDEMLADTNLMLTQIVDNKAGYDIAFAVNESVINGSGTGQPEGILNSAALVTVTADSGDEYVSGVGFSFQDLRNMLGHFRKVQGGKSRPVWFIGYDSIPAVYALKDDSNRSLFIPSAGGQIANAPYGTLMGIPIVPSDHCQKYGNKGDIILADMGAYVWVTKAGQSGVQAAQSVHLWFDKDKTALRFTIRVDGKTSIVNPFTLKNASTFSMSPFVTLGNRT